jgi:formylglycine-generating enzyme required for sulfatase activity
VRTLTHRGHELVVIPTQYFTFQVKRGYGAGGNERWWEQFDPPYSAMEHVGSFAIDRHEVTNVQFATFLRESGYVPRVLQNFLRHWEGEDGDRRVPTGLEDHPVVWVSLADARAYCAWAGLRLPKEPEWQLAAGGTDGRAWPWGPEFDPARCNSRSTGTTPVTAYPNGASPYGCLDMAGNVWEWVDAEGTDGAQRYCSLKAGSWYGARGASGWYTAKGAVPVHHRLKLLMLHDSYDRASTVGFRAARDLT